MMLNYVPAESRAVQGEQIPSPDNREAFGEFVGRLIVQGYVRAVQIIDPRDATAKSPATKGGLYFRPIGSKGFTGQPGDWLVLEHDKPLRAMTAEKWDKLGLIPQAPPVESHQWDATADDDGAMPAPLDIAAGPDWQDETPDDAPETAPKGKGKG
jgi:hypothetical protein